MSEGGAFSRPGARFDRILGAVVWLAAGGIAAVLIWITGDTLQRGLSEVDIAFLTTEPTDAGRRGGIVSVVVSTLMILAVTLTAAVPLALGTAVFLADVSARWSAAAAVVRWSLDVLAAVPSIVFGLFGNALFCVVLGLGYSILSGGLTLACMVLPVMIRTAEQALRSVPAELRMNAAALGLRRTARLWHIEFPAAVPGMAAGLVLGIGRALAETAALIFTAGYATRMPTSVMDSGRALSVHVYELAMNVPMGDRRAAATATILMILVLCITSAASSLLHRRRIFRRSEA